MKKISVLVATVLVAMGMTSCGNSHRSASLKTGVDSASYAIGIANGAQFRQMMEGAPGEPMNMDDLLAGFEVALKKQRKTYSRRKVVCSIKLLQREQVRNRQKKTV